MIYLSRRQGNHPHGPGIITVEHVRETEFLGVDDSTVIRSQPVRRDLQPADPHLLVLGEWAESRMRGLIADRRQVDIEESIATAKESTQCAA